MRSSGKLIEQKIAESNCSEEKAVPLKIFPLESGLSHRDISPCLPCSEEKVVQAGKIEDNSCALKIFPPREAFLR